MRDRVRTLLWTAVVAALVLAGCTADGEPEPSPSPTSAAVPDPSPMREGQLKFEPELVSVGDGERVLTVRWSAGGCLEFDRFEVDENDSTVKITSVLTYPQPVGPGGSPRPDLAPQCRPAMSFALETITLEDPVGEREVTLDVRSEASPLGEIRVTTPSPSE